MVRQAIILLLLSVALALVVNSISPNSIPLVGNWREISSGDGPVIPPDAEEGDPPFVGLEVARMEHDQGEAVFIDAREPEEFVCGTIPGSVNVPFDYLPSEDLDEYFDTTLAVPRDRLLIVFCSGEECDQSLHLGRNLQAFGYTNVAIFFGGSREWEEFGEPIQRSPECAH
jgi:rhodanese-related sulfurtransferase